ncbi:MAG: ABC transporter permease [Anaerolineae bacterium]|jgi:putative ABC transport system permease protein
MSIIWHKVRRDLWRSKLRTSLIVLSTAVGVFALGFVYGTSDVLQVKMTKSHEASVFPHIVFYTGLFDRDDVDIILREANVADAEGQRVTTIRWKLEGEMDWRDGTLYARDDYQTQRMDLFALVDGHWPTGRELAVERLASRHFGVPLGTTIVVEFGRSERRLPIQGVARQSQVQPPQWGGDAVFYATMETFAWLADADRGFNRLNVRLSSFSEEGAEQSAEQIEDRLDRMDIGVGLYQVYDPDVHWLQETIDSILTILKVLGALSLALSGFLIINMMNATVAQQVWQIGVMKVVGATRGRVLRVYLSMAGFYGLLSLVLAVLPGAAASHLLAGWLLGLMNIVDETFRLMPKAVGIQLGVGLAVPLVAALVPVTGGARITPHQAISNYGLGGGFGRSWLDRLIARVRRLPRPLALSVRNTFRRKLRITLTLITLVLGGMMFIIVMSVGSTLTNTIDVLLNDFGFDVLVVFDRPIRAARLMEATTSVDGVALAEVWDVRLGSVEVDGGESIDGQLWGVPDNSEMFNPRIISGRALLADDERAILLNSKIASDYDIKVGESVTLTVEEKELNWTVVGLVVNLNNLQRDNFVPFDTLAREIGNANRGNFVMLATEEHDVATHERVIRDIRGISTARRIKPVFFQSGGELRQQTGAQFDMITNLMLVMAILAAAVGGVGLMTTMSINVVERGREIGVMRAIGASSSSVLGIFIAEGVLVGVLSWLLAVPLSYPGARVFSGVVGRTLLEMPLNFEYSVVGGAAWLGVIVVLSALASLWPALRATQVSVREALAYE